MKMRTKMVINMILFIVAPMIIISNVVNVVYQSVLTKKTNSMSQQTLAQISNNVDTLINNIIASSNIIVQDQEIISILSRGEKTPEDFRTISRKLVQAQSSVLYAYNTDMVVYDRYNHYYTLAHTSSTQDLDKVKQQQWYLDTLDFDGFMNWCSPDDENLNFSDYTAGNICMARVIKDRSHKESYGVLLISVYPTGRQEHLFKNIGEDDLGDFYVVNTKGNIVMSSQSDMLAKPLQDMGIGMDQLTGKEQSLVLETNGKKNIVNYYVNPKSSFTVIQVISEGNLMKEVYLIKRAVLVVNIISLTLFLGCCIWLSRSFTNPLMKLCQSMKQAGKGDFSKKISITGHVELEIVAERYNTMIIEIERLMWELEQSHYQREDLRYRSLQAQINPHFILNTLNGIKILAQMDGAEQAAKMIVSLGNMLEHLLNRKEEMVELQEEITCVQNYCMIQKMRYGDNFVLSCDIPSSACRLKIPSLLLQPLVENAIIHGIHQASHYGEIHITAFSSHTETVISIQDNGIGMTQQQIEQIFLADHGQVTGIGVKNVAERIQLIFGPDSGIRINSIPGKGTEVDVILAHSELTEADNLNDDSGR